LGRGRSEFSRQHLGHHANTRYFTPTRSKIPVALVVIGGGLLAVGLPFGWLSGAAFTTGLFGFYLFYELLHRRIHTHAPFEPYGRWARRHHLHHHFCNPKANHGVTSALWDVVFGTYEKPALTRIPPKQEPGVPWLFSPETGELRPRYAADYEQFRRVVMKCPG